MSSKLNTLADMEKYLVAIAHNYAKNQNKEIDDRKRVLGNLYSEAVLEAQRLQKGQHEIVSIASAVRNIFEIHLIIEYLASSDEAVKRWVGQVHNDALEIHDGLIGLFSRHGFSSEGLNESRNSITDSAKKHGVVPSKPFKIKAIAAQFGWAEAYDAMYKLCSKIVHPSAIRVNLPGVFDKNEEYKRSLVHIGVHHIALIAEHSNREFT